MNEEFNKFKKKILKEHLAKCLVMSISISAILVALFFVVFKRIPLNLHFIIYILMFLLLASFLSWFLYQNRKPSDEAIAKRLDQTFSLKEKVQTMVVCENIDNEILKMQRQDAENCLKNVNPKALPLKLSFINYLALLIAVIFVSSSFFVPAAKATSPDVLSSLGNTSDTTSGSESGSSEETTSGEGSGEGEGEQSYQEALDEIRNFIENSSAEEKVKEGIIAALDKLEENLNNAKTEEEQAQAIEDAIKEIEQIVDEANSKDEIGESLKLEPNQNLVALGDALILGKEEDIKSALDNLENEFVALTGEALINDLKDVASQILDALINSGVNEDDELYMALNNLLTSLTNIADSLKDALISEEAAKSSIHEAIEKAKEEILKDILLQNANQTLGDQVIESLKNMLGEKGEDGEGKDPSEGDGKEDETGDSQDPEKPDDSGDNQPELGGDGETIYGSDDQIFSDKGHSNYGEVLDNYYDRIVDESTNGEVPDDLGDILGNYFGSLY